MDINVSHPFDRLSNVSKCLLKRMLSPLCGIDHEIGFLLRSSQDARVVVTGAEMTGVHTLLNTSHPGRGAYHLGGCGIRLNEAVIKTLGETVERYSQVISEVSGLSDFKYASYQDMAKNNHIIPFDSLIYFLPQQYYQTNFPFDVMASDQPMTWVKLNSLLSRKYMWVPAQLVFVGYKIKRSNHEPWIATAVTTGTAAHTNQNQALVSSILELIQIDSAMGHWYSGQYAPKINFDSRVAAFDNILSKYVDIQKKSYHFHWLKNPDLPGFSIACVYRGPGNSYPHVAVGLGSDISLVKAMYKAFLEAVGIIGLSRMIIFDRGYHLSNNDINPSSIYDLDTNVAYYALGHQKEFIDNKFSLDKSIDASDLPPDLHFENEEAISMLLESFTINHKELLFYNLTTVEAESLGFVVPRVWSPDLLPLCFPSAPFLNSPRYKAYGGVKHDKPHPYP